MRGQKTDVAFTDVNWSALRSLIPYLLEFRLRIGFALVCLVAAKMASVGLPFILKHIIDHLDGKTLGSTATASTPLESNLLSADLVGLISLPLGLLIAYGLVRFSNVLFGELRDSLFGRVTERAMRRVGLSVFRHMHALDLDFHLNRRTGGLSRDIERGTNGISFLMRFMVFNIVPTLLEIGMVVTLLLLNYDPYFAVIVLFAVILYVGYSVFATEWRTHFIRAANAAESATSTRAVDSLMNYETVKYFTNEDYEANEYDRELAHWETARRKNRLTLFALNAGQAFVIAAAMTAAMVLSALGVIHNTMTLGDFVLINALMMQIFMPLNLLGFVYREMKSSMANIEKMFDLLGQKSKVVDTPEARELQVRNGEISFNQVSFRYHEDRSILEDVSFTIPARQKVAVVGASGAGKSTLLKLLFRFYDVSAGSITIDGQDIRQLSLHSLRANIGVVPQDTVLFNTSIMENIRYGRIEASDEEVMTAIKHAHLADFVTQLPDGVNTLVGERGLKLSGGEKQRVAIARTILKQPSILVFDEATSSLDSKSEKSILEALEEISQEQTSLVIAHRLSTIVKADKIIVLDQGRIVEQGCHADLLAYNGKYAQLWQMQQQNH
ncbi:ABCB family ABC transporter ATP-binding protein/permease [Teredinibacter waterburyi]|uniref:ABCB family ABC transporter ATP-binding protein/permease n=1 Tax=Teredinibacter waterburyi TaxID=1500538 RepID=UPI00165F01AF|nr:ABC transporter ATP-binding protein/permease [Teredinibacter waterburyi]